MRVSRLPAEVTSPLCLAWVGAFFLLTFGFVAGIGLTTHVGVAVWLPLALAAAVILSGLPVAFMWPHDPGELDD